MVSGSAALPEAHFREFEEITGQRLLERFGMTELNMALSNPYRPISARLPGSVGMPLPGVTAALLNADGTITSDRDGECELLIKSPTMFDRYLNKPEVTAAEFHQGWFKTGDYVHYDGERYRILGRLSQDIIKKAGYKISALEIESYLLQ